MDINEKRISEAEEFIRNYPEVLMIEDSFIIDFIKSKSKNIENGIESLSYIIAAFKYINEIPDKTDTKAIVDCLYNLESEYHVKECMGYILVLQYGVNTFDIINNFNSREVFWSENHYFTETFEICGETDFQLILECIKKVYEFSRGDMAQGWVIGKINSYLKKHFENNEKLVENFYKQPEDSLQSYVMNAINNILEQDEGRAVYVLEKFLNSETVLHHSTACACYANLVETHWDISNKKIDKILSLCETWSNDFFVGNAVRFFISILGSKQAISDSQKLRLQGSIMTYSRDNDYVKLSILLELNRKIDIFNDFQLALLKDIFCTIIGNNLGLIQELDHTSYRILNKDKEKYVYELLKIFYIRNRNNFKEKSFSDCFNTTLSELHRKHINQIIPEIYLDVLSGAKTKIEFALEFINKIAFGTNYQKLDLLQGAKKENTLKIIKVISTLCVNADFVCFLGIKLLEVELADESYKDYEGLYINRICGNYPSTSKRIAESYNEPNIQQKMLINNVISYINENEEKRIQATTIKDLKPSTKRTLEYRIARAKWNKKIMDMAHEKSILTQLCSKQHIKYGKRYTFPIQLEDSKASFSENEFSHFEYSQEIPLKYLSDPLGHFYDRIEIFKQGGDENEISD